MKHPGPILPPPMDYAGPITQVLTNEETRIFKIPNNRRNVVKLRRKMKTSSASLNEMQPTMQLDWIAVRVVGEILSQIICYLLLPYIFRYN